MNKQEEIQPEYHEHPLFNGQYHTAVNDDVPEDAPVSCVICGRLRGVNNGK